ncbi:MAG: hypothetical protein L0177_06125 [Chloroflexi bacterium]|nr:hypothetical protein [Chloroflexota bacterium]
MANTYSLQLTQLESLYLSDALSMFTQPPPDEAGQGTPYPNLLLKIGGAILEGDRTKAPSTVNLSLPELWIVREVAKSSVVVGNERVGLSLLLKTYEGLRALVAESDMQSVVDDLGEVEDDEPGKADYAARLAQLKEAQSQPQTGDDSEEERDGNSDDHNKPNDADKNRPNYHA